MALIKDLVELIGNSGVVGVDKDYIYPYVAAIEDPPAEYLDKVTIFVDELPRSINGYGSDDYTNRVVAFSLLISIGANCNANQDDVEIGLIKYLRKQGWGLTYDSGWAPDPELEIRTNNLTLHFTRNEDI